MLVIQSRMSDLQEIRDKAKTNDVQGVRAVVPRATQDNKQSNQLATQLGLKVCSQD